MALASCFNAISSSNKAISPPSRNTSIISVSGHGREEVDRNWTQNVDEMWTLLRCSKDTFITKYENAPTERSIEKEEQMGQGQDRSVYCKLLNRLGKHVRDRLELPVTEIMKFVDIVPKALVGHPATADNCPEFIAVSLPVDQEYTTCPRLHWSELEMTGGITSKGEAGSASYIRAASCAGYLLQTRPDRTTVLGISVDQEKFRLIFTNAFGIFYMLPIDWDAPRSGPLLCAWLSRLYAPSFDESVKRVKSPDGPTFIITVNSGNKEKFYSGCFIYGVGGPFHRRTIVLMDGTREAVIKEQYNEVGQRFKEGHILDIIHTVKTFPGVVRKVSYDVVQSGTQDLIVENAGVKREKARLVMSDKGGLLMDAETPLEALIAFYDLLEVTRFLYTKRGVLHWDISSGNVLLRTEFPSGENFSEDLGEMCFASFLLKEGGTPIFMARIVRSRDYPEGVCNIPAMPQLDEGKPRYEHCVGARLAAFPDNNRKILRAKKDQILPFFLHKLCYDAESVFWLLLYWCILAKPEKDPVPQEIPSNIWDILTFMRETRDNRNANFVTTFPGKLCHSTYAPLDRLLGDMAAQLRGDPDFFNEDLKLAEDPFKGADADSAENSSRLKDEYLHEAFQRLIFNLLFKHYNAEFMKETKSNRYRELEDDGRGGLPFQRRSSKQMNRKRKAGNGAGETGDGSNDTGRNKRIYRDETPADVSQMLA